jgi:hypothetical protein
MESEDPPYENPLEREYHRLLEELASQKLDCEARISKLVRETDCVDGSGSGGDGDQGGAAGGNHHQDVDLPSPNITTGYPGNSSHIGSVGTGTNGSTFADGGVTNNTSRGHLPAPSQNVSDFPDFDSHPNVTGSVVNSTGSAGTGCLPCPILHDGCGPSAHGDPDPITLATPEAILVGAAAAVLVLVVAAAVAILVRYLPTITSGLLIVATIVLVWYLSSMYPEAARRLGARLLGALRRAATSIVDRVLRRHHPEVKCSCIN